MSKKMKRVAFESSSHESYEDARARFKHQALLQDFLELQQETEAQRNNLTDLKRKKLTLQAEVRFLRKRYNFLINNKSSIPQEQLFAKSKPTQVRKSKKEKVNFQKQATLRHIDKKKAISPVDFDLNLGNSLHVKDQSVQRAIANQRVRINGPKTSLIPDSGPKDNFFRNQEPVKKPVIDLNQISIEEEELQEVRAVKRKISWQDPVALSVWGL